MIQAAATKQRSFPWRCPKCALLEVMPAVITYTAEVRHDGVNHTLVIPALEVARCQSCGGLVFSRHVDEQINAALRDKLRLLKPEEIAAGRNRLGMSRRELAEQLGLTEETVSDWEEDFEVVSRAVDNLLRAYFALPENAHC